jgi:hypothetical protein
MAVNAAAKADKSLPAATRKAAQAGQGRFHDALTDLFVGAKVEGRFPVYSPDPEIDGHEDTKQDETDQSHAAPICFEAQYWFWGTECSMQHAEVFVATLTSRCLLLTCR